jgi:hypothetical protein
MTNRVAHPFVAYCPACDNFRTREALSCTRPNCGAACNVAPCAECVSLAAEAAELFTADGLEAYAAGA